MEEQTGDILKSVIETLMKKEAGKFRTIIQKELASKVHTKIEELKKALSVNIVSQPKTVNEVPMAPSAPVATTPTNSMDTMGTGAPAPVKPLKPKDIKIVPTAAGANKDDVTLDPNFEKEFYHANEKYKNQEILIKQLGTGFGKPVRVYINGRRWEFFPGPKAAMKAAKTYIDGLMKDVKKDPELAANMTAQIKKDKSAGVSQDAAPVDAGKPNEVADADLKKRELEKGGGKPPVDPKKAKKPPMGGK